MTEMLFHCEISKITLSGWNKRGDEAYQDEAFQELKKSIQEHGFWEHKPLLVRAHKEGRGYQLLAGHRRLRAAKELGSKTVPVIIREYTDPRAKMIVFLDNFHHKDLEPLEEAAAIQELLSEGEGITQEALAKEAGKSQAWIANRLRLLKAPDELKEMIISREISPKHVMALLPYVEYAVFKEVILPDFKHDIELGKHIAVSQMETTIDQIIRWRDDDTVLQLHDLPCEYKDFFDLSKCEGCKDIYAPPAEEDDDHIPDDDDPEDEKQEPERFCLNRKCWADKLNIAKQKYEKARAAKIKTSGKDDTVDMDTLKYNEYERIGKWSEWDKTECQTCKSKKIPLKQEDYQGIIFVCMDPPCAKAKEQAHRKEELKQAREEAEKGIAALDAWLDSKPIIADTEIRGVIKLLVYHLWGESIKAGLKPWDPKAKKWDVAAVNKIPDDDVAKALLRLVCMQELTAHNYHGINQKSVEKVIAIIEGKPLPKEE